MVLNRLEDKLMLKHVYFDVSNNYDCGITSTHNVLLGPSLTIFHLTDHELKPDYDLYAFSLTNINTETLSKE